MKRDTSKEPEMSSRDICPINQFYSMLFGRISSYFQVREVWIIWEEAILLPLIVPGQKLFKPTCLSTPLALFNTIYFLIRMIKRALWLSIWMRIKMALKKKTQYECLDGRRTYCTPTVCRAIQNLNLTWGIKLVMSAIPSVILLKIGSAVRSHEPRGILGTAFERNFFPPEIASHWSLPKWRCRIFDRLLCFANAEYTPNKCFNHFFTSLFSNGEKYPLLEEDLTHWTTEVFWSNFWEKKNALQQPLFPSLRRIPRVNVP